MTHFATQFDSFSMLVFTASAHTTVNATIHKDGKAKRIATMSTGNKAEDF